MKFVFGKVENILGKEENASNLLSILFLKCLQKPASVGLLKAGIMRLRNNSLANDTFLGIPIVLAFLKFVFC